MTIVESLIRNLRCANVKSPMFPLQALVEVTFFVQAEATSVDCANNAADRSLGPGEPRFRAQGQQTLH